jgi:hypothetical protein
MSNAVYPKAREAFLKALIDLSAVSVKALLVDGADYTYDASHEFLSSVPSGARIATSGALGSKTFANGVFDSADPSSLTQVLKERLACLRSMIQVSQACRQRQMEATL